jgi:hypothetical protein
VTLTKELLLETSASVLADCAFLILDPAVELPPHEGAAVVTTLSFSGAASGVLRLCAPQQMLVGAAADMLGQAPGEEPASEEAEATLAELGNVLLGVLLARAFGARNCPVIGLPQTSTVQGVRDAENALCSAVLVDLEGQPLVVSILSQAEVAA